MPTLRGAVEMGDEQPRRPPALHECCERLAETSFAIDCHRLISPSRNRDNCRSALTRTRLFPCDVNLSKCLAESIRHSFSFMTAFKAQPKLSEFQQPALDVLPFGKRLDVSPWSQAIAVRGPRYATAERQSVLEALLSQTASG